MLLEAVMKEVASERCFRKEEGGRGRGSSSGEGVYPVSYMNWF